MLERIFRGKRSDNGKWVEGSLASFKDGDCAIFDPDDEKTPLYQIDPETLGQYTGLKDNNGVMVWEGDIVAYEDESPGQYEYHDSLFINRGVIKFSEGCFYFTNSVAANLQDCVYKGALDFVIVGNIHDNPELLEIME